jgi:osmotically-inducible protein OsmY
LGENIDMNDDERIKKAIEGALTHDIRINLLQSDLEITCDGGEVTLSGTISSIAGKRLARRLAEQVPGVRKVSDLLETPVTQAMGDKEITQHVRHSFIQERNIEEEHIDIQTDQRSHVLLRGTVRSLVQLRLCEVLSWWVPGVRNVHNLLVVNPHEEDNDEELKDNLLTILEKDPLVDPKHFQLLVGNRTVTLRGRASSRTERDAAEKDCWYTPGVADVDNQLEVG